jgi:hypothetical protein
MAVVVTSSAGIDTTIVTLAPSCRYRTGRSAPVVRHANDTGGGCHGDQAGADLEEGLDAEVGLVDLQSCCCSRGHS